jgi:hypothetical protein
VADRDPEVMAAVEKELKKNPDASVDELLEVATKVNSSMADLTKRQFHARYPLQVKRKLNPPKAQPARRRAPRKKTREKAASSGGQRDEVRQIFLRFATDLAAAEERKAVVRVVAGVDTYVDQILETVG